MHDVTGTRLLVSLVLGSLPVCRCVALREQARAGFRTTADKLKHMENKRAHTAMVEDFRRVEKFWMGLARHSPDQVHLFMYDDTPAFPLPHFGNREPKSCAGKSRILMVPWLVDDVGRGTRTYVYSFKGATIKGANRWSPGECSFLFCLQPPWCRCTNMYNVIRAAKTGPKRLARTCILLADNYSENKNNHVLAFCSTGHIVRHLFLSHAVLRRWYDEVQMVYTPIRESMLHIDNTTWSYLFYDRCN